MAEVESSGRPQQQRQQHDQQRQRSRKPRGGAQRRSGAVVQKEGGSSLPDIPSWNHEQEQKNETKEKGSHRKRNGNRSRERAPQESKSNATLPVVPQSSENVSPVQNGHNAMSHGVSDNGTQNGNAAEPSASQVSRDMANAMPVTSPISVQGSPASSVNTSVVSQDGNGRGGDRRMSRVVNRLRRSATGSVPDLMDTVIDEAVREHAESPFFMQIFNALTGEDGLITGRALFQVLEEEGIHRDDTRLKEFRKRLEDQGGSGARLDRLHFCHVIWPCESLITAALTHRLVVPDFASFTETLAEMFEECREFCSGKNADYIPPLAEVDPEHYAMAVCTIDGQVAVFGDHDVHFCIQSCSKPLTYALAVTQHGLDKVHHHIGREPSGVSFNAMVLKPVDEEDEFDRETVAAGGQARSAIPHNPCVNAGAIMACSLISPEKPPGARIKSIVDMWETLTNSKSQVNASVFASERDTADRNFALFYMMKEANALPKGAVLQHVLELYFQACSIEHTTHDMAVMAATLAKGGVNPFSGERIFDPEAVRSCLSLMLSCGMYDYSGEWAFHVGLPAKSGVGGGVFAVLPNIGGICVWSPRLDAMGNSVRAVEFFKRMVNRVAVHQFDSLSSQGKMNVTEAHESEESMITCLLYAAARGDLDTMRSLLARGVDVNSSDYDARSALHVACSDGNSTAARFLVNNGADLNVTDRWGNTPLSEARRGNYREVIEMLVRCGATEHAPPPSHEHKS